MIVVPDLSPLKPGECGPCKASVPPKVGYCAPARCYCGHEACPAFLRTTSSGVEAVDPIPLEAVAVTLAERRAAASAMPAQIRADLKARREARSS